MTSHLKHTLFAPSETADDVSLREDYEYLIDQPMMIKMLDSTPDPIVILNNERQAVYGNRSLLNFVKRKDVSAILGARPGELLNCMHSDNETGGCGTSEFCRTCGAVNAIISSQAGKEDVQECLITTTSGGALDLKVWATPIEIRNKSYTVFTLSDISSEKRRRALERIFFHDVLNTAGGIYGFSELLKDSDEAEITDLSEKLNALSRRLIEEINAQRELMAAETDDLSVHPVEFYACDVVQETRETYSRHESAINKTILLSSSDKVLIVSDKVLLRRVLGNLVKNALEAVGEGGEVSIGCRQLEDGIEFNVHNPTFIPRNIQLQIFQRSFSTKGMGRGLGTYSIKLLTEKYLKGEVFFTSDLEKGTTFKIKLPQKLK